MADTKTKCPSESAHRLPFGLKYAGRGCKHPTTEGMPRKQFLALDRVRCAECNEVQGILCLDCGRVY